MIDTLEQCKRKAKKYHNCQAGYWVCREYGCASDAAYHLDMSADEAMALSKAEHNDWQIQPGEIYDYWRGVVDGEFEEFKAISSVNDICLKHYIYPE